MKKNRITLERKLFLKKETIAALDGVQMAQAVGGNTEVGTGPCGMCQNTIAISCRTNCVTVAGATCTPDTICQGTNATCISCNPGTGCPTQAPLCVIN